jgi:hypothetical protein
VAEQVVLELILKCLARVGSAPRAIRLVFRREPRMGLDQVESRVIDRSGGLLAGSIYLLLSLLYFARGLTGSLSTSYIGEGTDPPMFMWFL